MKKKIFTVAIVLMMFLSFAFISQQQVSASVNRCKMPGCNSIAYTGHRYCFNHECAFKGCLSNRVGGGRYCPKHIGGRANGSKSKSSSSKSTSSKSSKTSTSSSSATNSISKISEGDVITLKSGATYYDGKSIPSWVFSSTLYYRGTSKNGIVFSTQKTGAVTGTVKAEYVTGASSASSSSTSSSYKSYTSKSNSSSGSSSKSSTAKCAANGCSKTVETGSKYCSKHTCNVSGCTNRVSGSSAYCSKHKAKYAHKSYNDGYDDVCDDGDYDIDRYNNDEDYARGVDDSIDEDEEDDW